MYKKKIAAMAAILFLSASASVPSMAAPIEIGIEIEETEAKETSEDELPIAGFEPITVEEKEDMLAAEIELNAETESESEKKQEETEEEIIEAPTVEETFRFFQVEKEYALSKRDGVDIYEKMDTKSERTGVIGSFGVLHILSDEMDGWYYVESGNVRGFIKSKYLLIGKKAEKYIKIKKEELLDTAVMLKEPYENEAFLYTQTTAYDTLVSKKYALAKEDIEILDQIWEEPPEIDISEENSIEEPIVVGTLKEDGLCYILDTAEEGWLYVESDDVRGFVQQEKLITGKEARIEVRENGEESYSFAEQTVEPEENKACYYTTTSVKEASVSGLIRSSMVEYAEQFLGNPYVWGGESLTNGADCSGFVQTIYENFGYGIPRVAKDQAYCAKKIPVEDALPGDLIFYERNGYIYHVVMSTGDGGTIEAQSSATGIVKSTVNQANAVWAVRIISDEDTDILEYLKKNNMAADSYHEAIIAEALEYGNVFGYFKLTAYCSCPKCCGIWSGGPTASGVMPTENHTVAMAGVPFGTELIINGKVYTVEDRGTPFGHVDIYMESHEEALQFGVQYAKVFEKK